MINIFRRKRKTKNILELSAAEQKKIYKRAADKSVELQAEVIHRYENNFGEKIQNSR